jgi:hypothetical protein
MQSSQSLPANSGEKDRAHHDVETVTVPSHHGQKVVMVGNAFCEVCGSLVPVITADYLTAWSVHQTLNPLSVVRCQGKECECN